MSQQERRKTNGFVNQLQTIVQVIGAAILMWVGSSLIDVRDRLIRLEVIVQTSAATSAAEMGRIKERLDTVEAKLRVAK